MKRNVEKLKPFDLEMAKSGVLIATKLNHGKRTWKYLAGPDRDGNIAVESDDGYISSLISSKLCMNPICWISDGDGAEDPVYEGDAVYFLDEKMTVDHFFHHDNVKLITERGGDCYAKTHSLSTKKPSPEIILEGTPLKVGDVVYEKDNTTEYVVSGKHASPNYALVTKRNGTITWSVNLSGFTRIEPITIVLEGSPLKVGDTVYGRKTGDLYSVTKIIGDNEVRVIRYEKITPYTLLEFIVNFTRIKPKTKITGWVVVSAHYGTHRTNSFIYASEQVANEIASRDNSVVSKVEWEE